MFMQPRFKNEVDIIKEAVGAIAPTRTLNGALFLGVSGAYSSGKIFEIEVL